MSGETAPEPGPVLAFPTAAPAAKRRRRLPLIGLTAKQGAALAALLQGQSQIDAAAAAGCSVRQLRTWLDEARFRSAYRRATSEALDRAVTRARIVAEGGIEVLAASLRSDSESIRVRAAGIAVNLIARLEATSNAMALADLELTVRQLLDQKAREDALARSVERSA